MDDSLRGAGTVRDGAFYRCLLENQCTALLLLDQSFSIRYMNAAAQALLYAGQHRMEAMPLVASFTDTDGVRTALASCWSDGHPMTYRELELLRVDGHSQTVDLSVSRLKEAWMGTRLLVEMQPVNQLLRLSREEGWQQAHRATRRLVRGVAHEVKNPLGGIRGAAQLLENALPDARWQEYIDVVIKESDRLRELADGLLGVRQAPTMQPVNIHECLERVRQLVEAEQPALPVLRDYDPSLPLVFADSNQMVQALLNLVRNARQALLENRVPDARIRLRTRAARQVMINGRRRRLALQIDVEDNGPGIPDSLREALFFPLVTGRAQGRGLGLAIAQDIVGRHRGLIECDSRPGLTQFRVLLPVEGSPPDNSDNQDEGEWIG